jgi:hypothetical protein
MNNSVSKSRMHSGFQGAGTYHKGSHRHLRMLILPGDQEMCTFFDNVTQDDRAGHVF